MTIERRQTTDRRKKPTPPISRYSFWGRRRSNRRHRENKNYYVDRYERRFIFLVLLIFLLCFWDAILTLKLLQIGGIELNPFMAFLIRKDPMLFLLIKFAITAFNVLILLIHKNFHVFGGLKLQYLIYTVFMLYFLLVLYEFFLFLNFMLYP